jgi:FkbH-like protein
MTKVHQGILLSDFNVDGLVGFFNNDPNLPKINTVSLSMAQIIPTIIQKDLPIWDQQYDFGVIWTQPQSVIENFNDTLMLRPSEISSIMEEVEAYANLLLSLLGRVKNIFVPSWVVPTYNRGLGLLDMAPNGVTYTLLKMNLKLAEIFSGRSNIYLLNTQKWLEKIGGKAFTPKLWYMGKIAFGNPVFGEITKDIKAALHGINGQSRKLIVLDLDDTLWGGIVGDIGWEHLQIGGHDPIGEVFVDFQLALQSLKNRGILLGLVSKNEENVALQAIQNHPEMVLEMEDFVGWKINWDDKAKNVLDLVTELNLGLQSVVFIDDNPMERARVREVLPEVLVPEWPKDKTLYKKCLLELTCFESPVITIEDTNRAKLYQIDQQRQQIKINLGSLEDWLKKMEIKVAVDLLNKFNLQRTSQLLNKTNQMNLQTRRLTESELWEWSLVDANQIWVFSVSDRLGSSGLTGIMSLTINNREAEIKDFVLSCRVFGRKIEETMIYCITRYARDLKLDRLVFPYLKTSKNKPCLNFLQHSGLEKSDKNRFLWKLENEYPSPESIELYEEHK